jgi:uncharacterized protein YjbI with pentapeptide repeats
LAEKREFARLEKGDVDYYRITDPAKPDYLRFELIEDQADKLFYTISVLNSEYISAKIDIPFPISNDTISKQITNLEGDVINCIFKEDVKFDTIYNSSHFKKCVFHKVFSIVGKDSSTHFNDNFQTQSISFSECIFRSHFIIQNHINYEINVLDNSEIETLNLSQGKFHKNVRFRKCNLNECSFENTTFHKLIDFFNSNFNNPTQFFHTDFMDKAIFSKTAFLKEVQFLYNKVKPTTYISFENAKFHRALDISRANFYCTFNFWSAVGISKIDTKTLKEIRKSNLYSYDSLSEFDENSRNDVLKNLRESLRTIKNNFKSRNDIVSSLEYQKEEMNIYALEVHEGKGNDWDKVILFFNKWSNNHGISFSRGIAFTLIISFFFLLTHEIAVVINYELIFNANSLRPLKEYFNLFVDYTVLTNFDIPSYCKFENNPLEKLWFYTGKIFIGFGYYQTIAAFRKFLKN